MSDLTAEDGYEALRTLSDFYYEDALTAGRARHALDRIHAVLATLAAREGQGLDVEFAAIERRLRDAGQWTGEVPAAVTSLRDALDPTAAGEAPYEHGRWCVQSGKGDSADAFVHDESCRRDGTPSEATAAGEGR